VDEVDEVLFASADDDYGASLLDEAGGQGFSDAARGSDDEDFFVGEGHGGEEGISGLWTWCKEIFAKEDNSRMDLWKIQLRVLFLPAVLYHDV